MLLQSSLPSFPWEAVWHEAKLPPAPHHVLVTFLSHRFI